MIGQFFVGFFIVSAGIGTISAGIITIIDEIKEDRGRFLNRLDYYGLSTWRSGSKDNQ